MEKLIHMLTFAEEITIHFYFYRYFEDHSSGNTDAQRAIEELKLRAANGEPNERILFRNGAHNAGQSNSYGLQLYNQNARGVNTTFSNLQLSLLCCNYDVILLIETWLDGNVNNDDFLPEALNITRCDRDK